MKPQETAPLLATLAPAALVVPPVAILVALVGVGLLWFLSSEEKADKQSPEAGAPPPDLIGVAEADAGTPQASRPARTAIRVTLEELAEALAYGARRLTRKEAVEALQTLGFRKTSEYKALTQEGKFGSLTEFTPDVSIAWKG
jgi:hypothetical protein